ncbi:MAG TPA: phage tail tube protein [Rhizomicrobium sp.]|jgi:hypothetical protein
MTNRLAGTAYVTRNGQTLMLVGSCTWSPSLVKRETVAGMDGVHGYKEEPISGFIEMDVRDSGDLSVTDINGGTDDTIELRLANGKTVIGRDMWTTEPQEVDATEGKFKVRWEGMQGCVTEN